MFDVPTPSQSLFPGLPRDVALEIVDRMDVDQLVQLKHTCSLADEYVAAVIHTRSRRLVDGQLGSYDNFIRMLLSCGGVVGGIGALYILYPYHGRPPFIDIFLPDEHYDSFVEYLVHEEGFGYRRVEPGADSLPDADAYSDEEEVDSDEDMEDFVFSQQAPHPGLSTKPYPNGVSVMHRFSRGEPKDAPRRPPLLPITSELHTALFNYVSPRDFVSSYPGLTRATRALLTPSRLEDYRVPPKDLRRAVAAFGRIGWDLAVVNASYPDAEPCTGIRSSTCGAATRYFGDRHSVRGTVRPVRMEQEDTDPVDARDHEVTVVWWRGGLLCAPGCHALRRKLVPGARMCLRTAAEGL